MDIAFWILLSLVMAVFIFKLGQSYERDKPALTFKFTCLQPRCLFYIETNNHDETVKIANEHALVHRDLENQNA